MDLVEENDVEEVVRKMVIVMCRCGGVGRQRGAWCGHSSATMLNSERSEGCSGWVDSEVVGLSVHAWSLVAVVKSVMITTIVVVVVLLPLMCHSFLERHLSQSRVAQMRGCV